MSLRSLAEPLEPKISAKKYKKFLSSISRIYEYYELDLIVAYTYNIEDEYIASTFTFSTVIYPPDDIVSWNRPFFMYSLKHLIEKKTKYISTTLSDFSRLGELIMSISDGIFDQSPVIIIGARVI